MPSYHFFFTNLCMRIYPMQCTAVYFLKGVFKKSGYFRDRLTVSVNPPPLTVSFLWNFFDVFFILDYDSMCSKKDFTQEKVNFHATTGIPNYSSYCCCPPDDHLQEAGPSGWPSARGQSLRIIICKRPAPPDDHLQEAGPSRSSFARGRPLNDNHEKGMKNAFLRPFTRR